MSDSPKKLKVLFVGWARISFEEREAGGLNMFCSALAAELVQFGLEISYLRVGNDQFSLSQLNPRFVAEKPWRGINCWRGFGSAWRRLPDRGSWWMTNPITQKAFNSKLTEFVREQGFDIVHFHTFEGYGFEVIDIIQTSTPAKVITTVHDFFPFCEQGHFFRFDRELCTTSDHGRLCAACRPNRSFLERGSRKVLKTALPTDLQQSVSSFAKRLVGQPVEITERRSTEKSLQSGVNLNDVLSVELAARGGFAEHQVKREENVVRLNQVGRMVVSTEFMKRSLSSAGIIESKIAVIPIGHPNLDEMQKTSQATALNPGQIIRFAYVGSTYLAKGLDTLLRAVDLLKDLSGKIEIQIHSSFDLTNLKSRQEWPAFLKFYDGFEMRNLRSLAKGYDVGLVPHKCYESCGYTLLQHIALKKHVIVSDLGGGTEILTKEQGLFIKPDSAEDLANAIRKYVDDPPELNKAGLAAQPNFSTIAHSYSQLYSDLVAEASNGKTS